MALTHKDLQKLIKFLQKNGVNRLKTAEFEIELGSRLAPKRQTTKQAGPDSDSSGPAAWDSLTDEQKLLWSSPSMNEESDANH